MAEHIITGTSQVRLAEIARKRSSRGEKIPDEREVAKDEKEPTKNDSED